MTRRIPLTQGKVAIVDDEDAHFAEKKWYAARQGHHFYAQRNSTKGQERTTVRLHREILAAPGGVLVDHKNDNGLDCRRENLRLCTTSQNQMKRKNRKGHSSRFKGVCWHRAHRKWIAQIQTPRGKKHLGLFENEIEAAAAYDGAAVEFFGEFARPNFPPGPGKNGQGLQEGE